MFPTNGRSGRSLGLYQEFTWVNFSALYFTYIHTCMSERERSTCEANKQQNSGVNGSTFCEWWCGDVMPSIFISTEIISKWMSWFRSSECCGLSCLKVTKMSFLKLHWSGFKYSFVLSEWVSSVKGRFLHWAEQSFWIHPIMSEPVICSPRSLSSAETVSL